MNLPSRRSSSSSRSFEPVLGRRFKGIVMLIRVKGDSQTFQIYAIRQSVFSALIDRDALFSGVFKEGSSRWRWVSNAVGVGASLGILTSMLVAMLGQARFEESAFVFLKKKKERCFCVVGAAKPTLYN